MDISSLLPLHCAAFVIAVIICHLSVNPFDGRLPLEKSLNSIIMGRLCNSYALDKIFSRCIIKGEFEDPIGDEIMVSLLKINVESTS